MSFSVRKLAIAAAAASLLAAPAYAFGDEIPSDGWTPWQIANHHESSIDTRMQCTLLGWNTRVQLRNRGEQAVHVFWQGVNGKMGKIHRTTLGPGDYVSSAAKADIRCQSGLSVNITKVEAVQTLADGTPLDAGWYAIGDPGASPEDQMALARECSAEFVHVSVPNAETFDGLCSSMAMSCQTVCDAKGRQKRCKEAIGENGSAGLRIAYCH